MLIATSFSIIYKSAKFFHFAHAVIIVLGAYFVFFFSNQTGLHLFSAILFSALCVLIISLCFELYLYKPFKVLNVSSWKLLIVSLGAYIVLQNIVSMIWGDHVQSFRTWPVETGNKFFGAYITDVQIIIIALSILLIVLTWLFLKKTKTGKEIHAISNNKALSQIFGISVDKVTLISFLIGSVLAAIAGILIASDSDMRPTMGFNWLLYGIIAMIIGGIGKIKHLIFGSMLLATSQHLVAYYLSSKWMDATAFIILIAFLAWKPLGFSGQKLKKTEI